MRTEQPSPNDQKPAQHLSKGEKLFNWLVYGGIAGVGTFILTLPTAYSLCYGKSKGVFTWAQKKLEKAALSPESVNQILMTTATMQGGNITVVPVKLLEDRKPEIVGWLNDKLGHEAGEADVNESPKQTWGSIIKARFLLAWIPVYISFKSTATIIGAHNFAKFEEKFAEHVICNPLKLATHIAGEETKAFRYGKLAALDVFATAAASSLLFLGTRIFGKKRTPAAVIAPTDTPSSALAVDAVPVAIPEQRRESFTQTLAAQKLQPGQAGVTASV